jgi:hypothetical protein
VGESSTLDAAEPAAAVADPPAASPGRAVPESAPGAAPQVLPSEQLRRLADRAAAALAVPVPAVKASLTNPARSECRAAELVEDWL